MGTGSIKEGLYIKTFFLRGPVLQKRGFIIKPDLNVFVVGTSSLKEGIYKAPA